MIGILFERLRQRKRTVLYPVKNPVLPEQFRGRPMITMEACTYCEDCIKSCPVNALFRGGDTITIDLCKCIFCSECIRVCRPGIIDFSKDHRLSCRVKNDLMVNNNKPINVKPLEKKRLNIIKRSLKLRQVSAGGCNACEADVNVLNTVVYDLQRFGIQFVASPRHADGILVTGPVTVNMAAALQKTYDAVASPKIVIAVGACGISGGIFNNDNEVMNGLDSILPVDLYIPGCPPHPFTILDGLLRLLGKIKD